MPRAGPLRGLEARDEDAGLGDDDLFAVLRPAPFCVPLVSHACQLRFWEGLSLHGAGLFQSQLAAERVFPFEPTRCR
jgi:hypothetical protein